MAKIHHTERLHVVHDSRIQPEDWKRFIEFPRFTAKWKTFDLDDEALRALELMLVACPKMGPVIRGTGGLRKVRFAREGKGKSSGFRIGYCYFEEFGIICLVTIYAKNEQANISVATKKVIKQYLEEIEKYLAQE